LYIFKKNSQVSPFIDPPKVPEVPWWKRYEPMTKILDTRSGNSTQFIDMLRSCSAQGVKVLVDVSFNLQADPVLALGLVDLPNATEDEQSLDNTNVYHYLNYLLGLGVAGFYVKCNEPFDAENWERIFRTVYTLTTDERFAQSERPIVLLETISEGVKSAVE
jgi:alpha-amylase